MHITYLSFVQMSGMWHSFMGSNSSAVFIAVVFENDLIYSQLCMDLLITYIILAHRLCCDHLTNDTNPAPQKIYPTVCVCACVCACVCVCMCVFELSTYVGMYKCMNIQYRIYGIWSFNQTTVQANHVVLLFQELRTHRLHTARSHCKPEHEHQFYTKISHRTWEPIARKVKSSKMSVNCTQKLFP